MGRLTGAIRAGSAAVVVGAIALVAVATAPEPDADPTGGTAATVDAAPAAKLSAFAAPVTTAPPPTEPPAAHVEQASEPVADGPATITTVPAEAAPPPPAPAEPVAEPVDWPSFADCLWPPSPNTDPDVVTRDDAVAGGLGLWQAVGGSGTPSLADAGERAQRAEAAAAIGATCHG